MMKRLVIIAVTHSMEGDAHDIPGRLGDWLAIIESLKACKQILLLLDLQQVHGCEGRSR